MPILTEQFAVYRLRCPDCSRVTHCSNEDGTSDGWHTNEGDAEEAAEALGFVLRDDGPWCPWCNCEVAWDEKEVDGYRVQCDACGEQAGDDWDACWLYAAQDAISTAHEDGFALVNGKWLCYDCRPLEEAAP